MSAHRRVFTRVSFLACLILAVLVSLPAVAEEKSGERAAAEARILADLKYIAGDVCEGRGVRTKGLDLAAEYLAQEFKKVGVKPGNPQNGTYFQPFEIIGGNKLVEGNHFSLKGPLGQDIALEMGKKFTVSGMSGPGDLTKPIVFVGYGVTSRDPRYDDYEGIDVESKLVLVLRRVPQQSNSYLQNFKGGGSHPQAALQAKIANAIAHKAAGVIFVNDNVTAAEQEDALMPFEYTAAMRENVGIPVVHVRRSVANQMIRATAGVDLSEIEKAIDRDLKPHSMELKGWAGRLQTRVERQVNHVKNVIAVLEGAGPLADETVVLGAHYDHLGRGESGSLARGSTDIHYGADDNGSGTVATVELARRFAAMPERQGRRLVFILFTGEERGLLGSYHYCRNPLYPLEKTVAMFNMDMVGRLRDDKLTIIGTGTGKGFPELVAETNKKHKFQIATVKGMTDGFGGSDHMAFYPKGIPVLFFFTGLHPQYHRPTDTVDTINIEGIARLVDMAQDLVQHLATVKERPEYQKISALGSPAPAMRAGTPRLGIQFDYADEKNEGAVVQGVTEGGVAAKGGIKGGDRIIAIGGKPIQNITGYMTVLQGYKKGDKIDVKVIRAGKEETLKIALE